MTCAHCSSPASCTYCPRAAPYKSPYGQLCTTHYARWRRGKPLDAPVAVAVKGLVRLSLMLTPAQAAWLRGRGPTASGALRLVLDGLMASGAPGPRPEAPEPAAPGPCPPEPEPSQPEPGAPGP